MKPCHPDLPVHDQEIRAIMNTTELNTIAQIEEFLSGTQLVPFSIETDVRDVYAWIQKTLIKFNYLTLTKHERGVMRKYIMHITGYRRTQCMRLILQHRKCGVLKIKDYRNKTSFYKVYTARDVYLLAEVDELHNTLSGYATKKLLERAYYVFDKKKYERLANISVSHIYNLRKSIGYKRRKCTYDHTKPKVSTIGERRKPKPNGKPGYIRIDTVHQGDYDGKKGVYHINAVDEVTQFEVVCTVEKISEQYLIPVLEELLNIFPFVILGFHSDNGTEYVNRVVADLLKKLHAEFTKSRPRHSNDNALAESKNGSVVRKALGYMHIPQHWADPINKMNQQYLNPYLNYHRPCLFAESKVDDKGKERKIYRYKLVMTPYEKLKSLPDAKQYLKKEITFEMLDKIATQISDNDAAKQLKKAKGTLFNAIYAEREASGCMTTEDV
jgi:transposase InsO family protein